MLKPADNRELLLDNSPYKCTFYNVLSCCEIRMWICQRNHFPMLYDVFSNTCANKTELWKSNSGLMTHARRSPGRRGHAWNTYGVQRRRLTSQQLWSSWHWSWSFSAKAVQNITDCPFGVPLWHLRGSRLFHQFLQPQQLVRGDLLLSHWSHWDKHSNMFSWWAVFLKQISHRKLFKWLGKRKVFIPIVIHLLWPVTCTRVLS